MFKRRAAGGATQPTVAELPDEDVTIAVSAPDDVTTPYPEDNAVEFTNEDGNVVIQLTPDNDDEVPTQFNDNLAEKIDVFELGRMAETLLEGIEADRRSYSEWAQERAEGLELLGMKVEKPGGAQVGGSSTAVAGQSTVRDAILAEACDRFQANAFAELCPSEGPCKVVCYGEETAEKDELAENLEKDINFYLTGSGGRDTATEYYPDTRRMLWWVGYASGMFKKVYRCPLRGRPVSEAVDGTDLIVNANVTDLHNAGRITHQISMRPSVLKRMQIMGVYRKDVVLGQTPLLPENPLSMKVDMIVGASPNNDRPEDQDYTILECYCEYDIPGYEHKQDGKITGLALPYKVTIEKDSRQILEVRRNWKPEDDEDAAEREDDEEGDPLPVAKIPFVQYCYASGIGFYGTGLLQRLGNYAVALTAMLRECIDAGMFASFPGFLYAKPAGRQLQNEFRVPPGGGAPIDVSAVGGNINNAVMALPYKDVSGAMVGLMEQTRQNGMRYGGTAEAPTGEGVANAPVGSVLAAIEQATRIEGGVHKALYAAQREELNLLVDLFREDPTVIWRGNKRPAMGQTQEERIANFKLALDQYDLAPASDPNVPSHMHRMAKANAYLQAAGMAPGVFNMQRVFLRWAKMVKIDGIESDFAPPNQPQPDPIEMAKLAVANKNADTQRMKASQQADYQQKALASKETIEAAKLGAQQSGAMAGGQAQPDPFKAHELNLKQQQIFLQGRKMDLDHTNSAADRDSKESVEAMKIAQALAVHPTSDQVVDQQLVDMKPFLKPPTQVSASAGGAVKPSTNPKGDKIAAIASDLLQVLQARPQSEYTRR